MKIRVLLSAWFIGPKRKWLGEYLDPSRFQIGYVGLGTPMLMGSKRTSLRKWGRFLLLAVKTRLHLLFHQYDAVVSAFPQGGFSLGLVKKVTFERTPHIVWYFNCGHEYRGLERGLARIAFRHVKRFIVYSRRERRTYARVFALPEERFHFTYLTGESLRRQDYGGVAERYNAPDEYIIALGSSGRDYNTFFRAVEGLEVNALVIAHAYAVEKTNVPSNVKVLEGIPQHDYLGLLSGAKICVLPIDNEETASGQMTLMQAMVLGVPVVATRCIGTEDYIIEGQTGVFVEMGNAEDLRCRLSELLTHTELLSQMSNRAFEFAQSNFLDLSAARVLEEILEDIRTSSQES